MDGQPQLPHKLTLNERQQLVVTGVAEVVSFDENMVALTTDMGNLMVAGSQLQLRNLSTEGGQIVVEGKVSAMSYEEPKPAGGWLGRLFR